MKNLQVIDILNSIIDGFNKQLIEANRNVYEGVDTNIRRNETFGIAPFNRREGENIWDIRVCVASNLTGDKFKTRRFTDYGNYINNTVYFQPIKGLDGTTIDFNQASTYSNIDGEDLETYVGLESEWLSRKIEGVFGSDGTFSTHQQTEYTRLYESFGEYYGDWQAGKALQGAGFYAKPMFPHGPNMMQTAVMVAGVAGGPWAAFAVSMLTTGVQVSDGSMSWKQGAFQVGMSAATACIGVGASELSGMVGGAASAATEAGSRTMTQIAVENVSRTAANTLASGVRLEGGSLGYDKDRMTSSRTWLAAGVTAGVGTLAAGYNLSGFSSAAVSGIGSSLSAGISTGDWSKSFQAGAINAAGNYFGGLVAGGISGGLGTENAYTQALISNYTTFGMRKLLGSDESFNMGAIGEVDTVNLVVQDMYKTYKEKNPVKEVRTSEKETGDKTDKFKDPFAAVDEALSGVFVSLGRGLGQTMKQIGGTIANGAHWAYNGLTDLAERTVTTLGNFAESTGNLFARSDFATDMELFEKNYTKLLQLTNSPTLTADVGTTANDSSNLTPLQMEEQRQQKIAELQATLNKLEKSNPKEAAWLREKVEMMQRGTVVNEVDHIDISNALNSESLKYYLMKDYMKADFEGQDALKYDLQMIDKFKEVYGREPSRFEYIYGKNIDTLTDPVMYRQNDGRGPVGNIIRNVFQEIIDNPDGFSYMGNDGKYGEKQFQDLKNSIINSSDNMDNLVTGTADGSCYIESLYFLSVANGSYNGELEDFMTEGLMNGDFGQKRNGSYQYDWVNKPGNYVGNGITGNFNNDAMNKLAGDNQYAIVRIDRSTNGNQMAGTHYSLIGRDANSWNSYDHDDSNNRGNFRWRNEKADWERIRRIYLP